MATRISEVSGFIGLGVARIYDGDAGEFAESSSSAPGTPIASSANGGSP